MAALPPAQFRPGGQHLFYEYLPLMMLFSVSCPLPLATLSSQPPTGLLGLPGCAKPCHNHTLLAEAGATSCAFRSVWVTSGPDGKRNHPLPFPFSSSLVPACIPSLCLCLAQGGGFGDTAPWCSQVLTSLLSILLPQCLLPSLRPACGPSKLTRRLAPRPLLTYSRHLQNSFSPLDINFSPFFFSLLVFFSPHSPAAHPR